MKPTIKLAALALALALSLALAGCGGGGGGSTSSAGPTTTNPGTPSTPSVTAGVGGAVTARDPYFNQIPEGTLTDTVTGVVFNSLTAGAVVSAYELAADGGNGALLGTSSATGTDGRFTIKMNKVPTGMVRLVAVGGSYLSEGDGSRQENRTLELVTPYVTSEFNSFVITPITHVASVAMRSRVPRLKLAIDTGYTDSIALALSIGGQNPILRSDRLLGVNVLKTVPGSANDEFGSYLDAVTSFELFGVLHDLPSKVVISAIASAAEADYRSNNVNGIGEKIRIGNWINGSFDESAPRCLSDLTAFPANTELRNRFNVDLLENEGCTNKTQVPALLVKAPILKQTFESADSSGRCAAVARDVREMVSKKATNNRSK